MLCFNITLAARLRELAAERGIGYRVNVHHFHDWCGEQLRLDHIERPDFSDRYLEDLIQTVIAATHDGRIPKGQHGAVMIDEGHDFEAEWLRLVVDMVDPESDSLLLLYDDAQSIYPHRKGLEFPMVAVSGIGDMPIPQAEPTAEAKLLYVAMTRSTRNLLLCGHRESLFMRQLKEENDAGNGGDEERSAGDGTRSSHPG